MLRRPDSSFNIRFPGGSCPAHVAADWSGPITIIIHDIEYINHYFHFVEMMIGIWAVYNEYLAGNPVDRIIFTNPHWNNIKQHGVQRQILDICFPGACIDDPSTLEEGGIERVVFLDRSRAVTTINKFLEPLLPLARRWTPSFVGRIRRHLGAPSCATHARRALYTPRLPPRRLAPALEDALLDRCAGAGLAVEQADYAALDWPDQVRLTAGCNVMIGVHGNGLTNLLWLPPGAFVLEIFVAGAHHYDYQLFAELAGHTYFGVEGREGGYVFREHARFGGAYGDGPANNQEIPELNWGAVDTFLSLCPPAGRGHGS